MALVNFAPASSKQKLVPSHSHNLSINSVSSIAEPSTPPSVESTPLQHIWASNKITGEFVLPSFKLGSSPDHGVRHTRKISLGSCNSDKENQPIFFNGTTIRGTRRIDKEYLASIAKVPLSELCDEILTLAKDQHGCRFLQKRIDASHVSNFYVRQANYNIIFGQVKASLYELIIDPFGNYLLQKLTDYFKEADLDFCITSLHSNMFLIAINQHGTRALQKLIHKMTTDSQFAQLAGGLKPYIIELIKDLNGNHVIQKVLKNYSPQQCQFIYDSILADLLVVATHKHGCCVLQRCLNHVTAVQHAAFADVILDYNTFSRLVNDQFGNYILQYLISIGSIDVNYKLYQNISKYGLGDLCVLKFSSNVVEKLLMNCFENETRLTAFSTLKFTIIAHILKYDLDRLINNAYGNYVVQTSIDILIHDKVTYYINLPSGERILLPALQALLDDRVASSPDTLQVQIIKRWFRDCRIDSTFGKRLQLKLNSILSGGRNNHNRFARELLSTHPNSELTNVQSRNTTTFPQLSSFPRTSKNGSELVFRQPMVFPELKSTPQGYAARPLDSQVVVPPTAHQIISAPDQTYHRYNSFHQLDSCRYPQINFVLEPPSNSVLMGYEVQNIEANIALNQALNHSQLRNFNSTEVDHDLKLLYQRQSLAASYDEVRSRITNSAFFQNQRSRTRN